MQEEIHHENHEYDRDDQSLHHIVDRGEQEVVGALKLDEFKSGGKFLRQFLDFRAHRRVHLGGVASGNLEHHHRDSRLSVYLSVEAVGLTAELDFSDVLEPEHRAVGVGPNHYILELRHALQTAAVLHRVLEHVARILSERSRGGLEILFVEHCGDIGRHKPVLGHSFRIQPDAHAVGVAHFHDISHAVHALYLRNHVYIEIV